MNLRPWLNMLCLEAKDVSAERRNSGDCCNFSRRILLC
jgi:hypothetical protein